METVRDPNVYLLTQSKSTGEWLKWKWTWSIDLRTLLSHLLLIASWCQNELKIKCKAQFNNQIETQPLGIRHVDVSHAGESIVSLLKLHLYLRRCSLDQCYGYGRVGFFPSVRYIDEAVNTINMMKRLFTFKLLMKFCRNILDISFIDLNWLPKKLYKS